MKICEKHKTEMIEKSINGYDFNICELCTEEENQKTKKREEEEKFIYLNRGIPKIFRNAKTEDFDNIKIKPVLEWIENPKGFLFIHGKCGCGKSHLMAAIKKHYNIKNIKSTLVFSSELFLKIRSSFNNNSTTEENIINEFTRNSNDICLFDDIGAQKISDYALEVWYDIIDYRYREEKPTLFTSNLPLKEICEKMSDRIASRLASGITFEITGNDRRIKKTP